MVLAAQALEIDYMKSEQVSLFSKRPALMAVLLFICGIFIALYADLPYLIPLFLAIGALFAIAYCYLKGKFKAAGWFTAALIILLGWYLTELSSGSFPPNHIENFTSIDGRVELIGCVVEEPDIREGKTYLVIEPDSILINRHWIPTLGKTRVSIKGGGNLYDHADYLKFSGYLYMPEGARNPGGFDYQAYLRSKEIFACMSVNNSENVTIIQKGKSFLSSVITPLRNWLVSKTKENLSPVTAAILSGFILGEQRDIPSEYQELFRDTGTLHLMAVSGSNVGVVLAIFAFPLMLLRVPRNIKSIILIFVVIFFAILTRLQPSVVRASIMALIGLLAYGWMRKPDYLNLLGLAALLMLLWRRLSLFDVGTQLSFAATFGLIYALPRILEWLTPLDKPATKWLFWILGLSLSTIAAQLAVLPLMAHYFQNIPLFGTIANIPVGLLAGLSTTLGIAFYFLSILSSWFGHLISIPLEFVLNFVIYLLRFFASLPYASIKVAAPSWAVIILYWLIIYIAYEIIIFRRLSRTALVASLIIVNFLIWNGAFKSRPIWKIEFLDLGRNHAWIFSDRNGLTMAGFDSYQAQDDANMIVIPYILNHDAGRLDYLFSATANSPEVQDLIAEFHPVMISAPQKSMGAGTQTVNYYDQTNYKSSSNFPAALKIIWDCSDNIDGGRDSLPMIRIDVKDGAIILASWTGTDMLKECAGDKRPRLLELPWSVYAQGSCLSAIDRLNPDALVFSPDKYAVAAPHDREELTYSQNRIYSTSICGGFSISASDTVIKIETMKAITPERK